ncbi:hypothetical protein [Streptomyces sp. YIM S03343]
MALGHFGAIGRNGFIGVGRTLFGRALAVLTLTDRVEDSGNGDHSFGFFAASATVASVKEPASSAAEASATTPRRALRV